MIEAVLFDFDGVLTTDVTGSQSLCGYLSKASGIPVKWLTAAYRPFNEGLLLGKISHEAIWPAFCEALGAGIPIEWLHEAFRHTPLDETMLATLGGLRAKGLKTAFITDNKADRIEAILAFYGLEPLFDAIALSARVGSGKGSAAIFEFALRKLRLPAAACVFIDNSPKNLVVPAAMGMKTHLFDHERRDYGALELFLARALTQC
jgi:putative hydrolase of the HAD superfamily